MVAKKSCPEPGISTAIAPIPSLEKVSTISATSTVPTVASASASSCKCGVKESSKIVGGQEANVSFVFTVISFQCSIQFSA